MAWGRIRFCIAADEIIVRTATRLIVLDSADRVLLLHTRGFPSPLDESWGIPGGEIEPGESVADAARRELLEETGIDVSDVGDLITTIESDYVSRDRRYQQSDHLFSARVNEAETAIDVPAYPAFLGYAWWDMDEAVSSGLRLFPEQLPEIVRSLLV